jgi:hypothetical protein
MSPVTGKTLLARGVLAPLAILFLIFNSCLPNKITSDERSPTDTKERFINSLITELPSPFAATPLSSQTAIAEVSDNKNENHVAKVDTVDNLWNWSVVAGPSTEISPDADFDGNVLTWMKTAGWPESQTQMVKVNGKLRELHKSEPGWMITHADVDNGRVVLVEYEPDRGDYHIWVYDLSKGGRTLVEEWGGAPERHVIPQVGLDGDWLTWNTSIDEDEICAYVQNLKSGDRINPVCSPKPEVHIGWVYLRWPVLTYTESTDTGSECRTIYTISLPDGEPQRRGLEDCFGYQGAGDKTITVWTEAAPSANLWGVPVYGESDGEILELGQGAAGSVAVCGERAFWLRSLGGHPGEILSWTPGNPVEVIYRSPDEGNDKRYATTKPVCDGSWALIERAGWQAGAPDEILIAWVPLE